MIKRMEAVEVTLDLSGTLTRLMKSDVSILKIELLGNFMRPSISSSLAEAVDEFNRLVRGWPSSFTTETFYDLPELSRGNPSI